MSHSERLARICIFCGGEPQDKNREHPLPQWLLALTGDPSRVVTHAFDRRTNKPIRYAFNSFAFPSCTTCNESWSERESNAKAIVAALSEKKAIAPAAYVALLDWLDKVRIGLWLGHRYLQQTPITPNFTIETRVARKDRMLAIYPIGDHQRGLNVYGAESLLFQFKPSAFALRINNILLLNCSWDWMCSARCGFPYPATMELKSDGASVYPDDFRRSKKPKHPVLHDIMKPSVLLFQPVLAHDQDGQLIPIAREHLAHCSAHFWPGKSGVGQLFRQLNGRVVRIDVGDAPIAFDSIVGAERRKMKDIAMQAYTLQNRSVENDKYVGDHEFATKAEALRREQTRLNRHQVQFMKSLTEAEFLEIWRSQSRSES